MTLRLAIRLGAAAFALLGVVVGVVGTLLMTRMYHPYTSAQIFRNIYGILKTVIVSGMSEAHDLLKASSELGEINKENLARSLFGLYLLILSFVFQTLGAVLGVMDVMLAPEH